MRNTYTYVRVCEYACALCTCVSVLKHWERILGETEDEEELAVSWFRSCTKQLLQRQIQATNCCYSSLSRALHMGGSVCVCFLLLPPPPPGKHAHIAHSNSSFFSLMKPSCTSTRSGAGWQKKTSIAQSPKEEEEKVVEVGKVESAAMERLLNSPLNTCTEEEKRKRRLLLLRLRLLRTESLILIIWSAFLILSLALFSSSFPATTEWVRSCYSSSRLLDMCRGDRDHNNNNSSSNDCPECSCDPPSEMIILRPHGKQVEKSMPMFLLNVRVVQGHDTLDRSRYSEWWTVLGAG